MSANSKVRQIYGNLCSKLKEISHLQGIAGLLDWDQNVMMPSGASEIRACQMSSLAGVIHEKATSPDLGQCIQTLTDLPSSERGGELNEWELANLRDAKRSYDKSQKIPNAMAKKLAELQSRGNTVWVEARQRSDFQLFAPVLKEWLQLLQERSHLIDPTLPVYQVLLDDYERGMTLAQLDNLFDNLKQELIPLIQKIQKSQSAPDTRLFLCDKSFNVDRQKELNHQIALQLGFDTEKGRLDVSVHPFTGGAHPTDVRMTTRYKTGDLIEGITGTIHETGHALYEQGRNSEYYDLPVSEALSMGLHESQSLFWERMIGLHPSFWKHFWPELIKHFPHELNATSPNTAAGEGLKQGGGEGGVTWEMFYAAINESKPGLIRVEADEVTYPLHIIIRYELEKGLFDGSVQVDDLPRLWNAKMKEYLGVEPDSDKMGVLQDTHWAVGLFGYFPTYTLGAIYASQLFEAMSSKDLPNIDKLIEQGDFKPIREWLRVNVHQVGSLYPSGDILIKKVTGAPLNSDAFVSYLKEKYGKLYKL